MTQFQPNFRDTIKEYAKERLLTALQEAKSVPCTPPETCEEYTEHCRPTDKVDEIRGIIDRPHNDDSPCENPVWEAIDDVINTVISGFEEAINE